MSESTNGPGGDGRPASAEPGEAQPADRLGMLQAVVAILLIISFLAVLALLVVLRGDQHWDRLVYLLSGFEAVVFVAVGAFFGTSAQRGAVVAARQDAATAREEAVSQRDRADAAAQEATAGRVLAQAIVHRAGQPADEGTGPRRASRDGVATDPALADLAALARSLFPPTGPGPAGG